MSRALTLVAALAVPAAAEACATCIASPFGDRTYNWPYLFLILLPFVVAAVIGGILAHASGVTLSALCARLARRFHSAASREETT